MTSRAEAMLRWLGEHEAESIALLEGLVNQDSGTYDRTAVNRVGDTLAQAWWT